MTSKKHYAFISIWKKGEGSTKGFALGTDLESLKTADGRDEASEREDEKTDEPKKLDGALDSTIRRIIDSNHSQSELLFISSFLVEGYPGMLVENDVISPIEKSNNVVETTDATTIYGLSEDEFQRILSKLNRMARVITGLKALPAALLMSIVATFDTNIADVVRDMLTLKADTFQTGSPNHPSK